MPIAIRQTILTPDADGQDVVLLHISDASPPEAPATFELRILVKMRALQTSTLGHLQRQAMIMAQDALTPLLQQLAKDIHDAGNSNRH